jgi:hypothetical protein
MTKLDSFNILNLIEKAYPLVTLKSETILAWMSKSESMEYNEVLKNVAQHIRMKPYPPTLKEITKANNDGTSHGWLDEYSIRHKQSKRCDYLADID